MSQLHQNENRKLMHNRERHLAKKLPADHFLLTTNLIEKN